MGSIAVVTFDCYGTLIDWETGIRHAFEVILEGKSSKIRISNFQTKWGQIEFALIRREYKSYKTILRESLEKTMKYFKLDYAEEDGEFFAGSMPTWKPFADVKSALKAVRRRSRIAIISNTDDDIIRKTVKNIGVTFDHIITAERAKAYKPNAKIFQEAIKNAGAAANEILHASFSFRYDLNPAKRLGFQTVWVKRKPEKDAKGKPDFEVEDLRGLLDILSG